MSYRLAQLVLATTALGLACCGVLAAGHEVAIWADAAEKPTASDRFTGDAYEVGVNATHFFTLRTAAAGYALIQRASIVDLRVTEVLSRRLTGPVTVSPIRGKPTIYVGPVRIVTVYPRDVAAANAASANELAAKWAAALSAGLPKVMPGASAASPVAGSGEGS